MTASNNGSTRNGKGGKSFSVVTESLREACPPFKLNELEGLVKELKGDEAKIREKISEWWDQGEGAPALEEHWEDVNKKHSKKKDIVNFRGRGNRGGGEGRGRGGSGSGREGRGRGGGRGRSSVGRGGRGRSQPREKGPHVNANNTDSPNDDDQLPNDFDSHPPPPGGIPANVRVPQGAWAKQQTTTTTPTASTTTASDTEIVNQVPAEPAVSSLTETKEQKPIAPPSVSQPPMGSTGPLKAAPRTAPVGNVWATKGSAHIIQAGKPKPQQPIQAPVAAPSKRSAPPAAAVLSPPQPISAPLMHHVQGETDPEFEPEPDVVAPQQQDILPPSQVQSDPTPSIPPSEEKQSTPVPSPPKLESSVWAAGPPPTAPVASQTVQEERSLEPPVPPSPIHTQPIGSHVDPPQPPTASQPPVRAAVPPKPQPRAPPPSVLNMGHWETDGDDKNIEFAFGAFGVDAEAGSLDATTSSNSTNNVSQAPSKEAPAPTPATAPSPARPPPGLSIGGGMRPIPPDAVLVHELENKLEEASLNAAAQQAVSEPTSGPLQSPSPSVPASDSHSVSADPVSASVNEPVQVQPPVYSQPVTASGTGGMGMYSYGGAPGTGAAFIGGMPSPGLGAPLPPKPLGVPLAPTQPQQGLYGTAPTTQPHVSANSSGTGPTNTNALNSATNAPTPTPGLPPGMPGMPYSPALFYGQQPHMGQYQGQIGYNYGYGAQFGGAGQVGFGYPPSMGHSGGYGGGPHYDDQGSHQGSSGYQNKSGGYRGRGNHHNNANQYQNQYNPQQHAGAYGGQPYGAMGYHGDFTRGGYGGPGGMQDHYIAQQQQPQAPQIGGFQSDVDQYKGKKGGQRGGYQQFQPGPPPHLNQQPFGLQAAQPGGNADSTNHSGPGGGASGSSGAGGWANQSSGGSGWGGGAPSWQGK